MAEESGLKFKKIDVSFIYGYVNYNLHKNVELPKEDENGFNDMWAPIYSINLSNDGYCIQKDLIENKPVTIISENGDKKIPASISAYIIRKRHKDKNFGTTDGGPGCLTIKVSVETEEVDFTTNTIFDILNLAPRTSNSPQFSTIEGLEELSNSNSVEMSGNISKFSDIFKLFCNRKELSNNNSVEMSENISKFSDIFRLFCNLLYKNQQCWSELYMPHQEGGICKKDCKIQCKDFYPFYDEYSKSDPQIPYMLVEGFLYKDFYEKVFIENKSTENYYTNEIGCLLGRWLNLNNKNHLNTDYYRYYKEIDAIIEKEENVFISRFRDKKTFVVLSSLMTLILKCKFSSNTPVDVDVDDAVDNAAADKAVQLTTNALLSYLEFSRTRLHNALWLNKQLDKLVNDVDDKDKTSEILPIKTTLNKLKVKVAKSMNNPISYMWDSVLGQEIPSLKINRNVEKLEQDTIQKLNLINELIDDRIDSAQISDFSKYINKK